MERKIELADIVREHAAVYLEKNHVTATQRKALAAIEACRTALLGGHMERCDSCAFERPAYNSCRNRHCPKCLNFAKEQWLTDRLSELLPVAYHHVVFTIPAEVSQALRLSQRVLYNVLFKAASEALLRIARDEKHLGARIGFIAVLHTWGQNLLYHPHLHCVVPAGGLAPDGEEWVPARPGFFLPVRVLSALFRSLFLKYLGRAYDKGKLRFGDDGHFLADPAGWLDFIAKVSKTPWVVYSKEPFGGPRQVLSYLGRYTHRVAITNNRLLSLDGGHVRFAWRDYSDGNRQKVMTLQGNEFLRRFLMHILPRGLQRLRYFGLFGNRYRADNIALCRRLIGAPVEGAETLNRVISATPAESSATEESPLAVLLSIVGACPSCKSGRLHRHWEIPPASAARAAACGYLRPDSS